MEKFSLFDLLGILMPGAYCVMVLQVLLNILGVQGDFFKEFLDNNIVSFSLGLFFSIVLGGLFFYLSDKFKESNFYKNILKIYISIGEIFFSIKHIDTYYTNNLNKQSILWFKNTIFLNVQERNNLNKKEKSDLIKLHGIFYSRAYYELQYNGGIDYPKTYQSFYFFFRNVVTISLFLIPICLIFYFIGNDYKNELLLLLLILIIFFLISIYLARYFRMEMVKKLYIIYSNYLINKK